jgi:hypothetical protein
VFHHNGDKTPSTIHYVTSHMYLNWHGEVNKIKSTQNMIKLNIYWTCLWEVIKPRHINESGFKCREDCTSFDWNLLIPEDILGRQQISNWFSSEWPLNFTILNMLSGNYCKWKTITIIFYFLIYIYTCMYQNIFSDCNSRTFFLFANLTKTRELQKIPILWKDAKRRQWPDFTAYCKTRNFGAYIF